MEDFKSYSSKNNGKDENVSGAGLFDLVKALSQKFDGKSQSELLSAIYKEAEKGKKNGTLTNADLESFAATISPFLDDKKKGYLNKILKELKKI
ncbi:MAG: hypothetical protein SPL13_01630 [Clostridia bacterium]|nr:hypothetical protein [Clostridia bacterium]